MEKAVNKEEVFQYLDNLRESGQVNMYGAREYVECEFEVGKLQATELLAEWMKTFSERHSNKEGK